MEDMKKLELNVTELSYLSLLVSCEIAFLQRNMKICGKRKDLIESYQTRLEECKGIKDKINNVLVGGR